MILQDGIGVLVSKLREEEINNESSSWSGCFEWGK
jgi:hypothetical protein